MIILLLLLLLILAYLLMIDPGTFKDLKAFKGRYYAHRGLHDNAGDAPENSLKAYRKAISKAYGIEFDVQLSKDHIPVLNHDFLLERMYRDPDGDPVKGKVSDYTLEKLREFHILDTDEKIPLLKEALDLVDGKVPLIIELKMETDCKDLSICEIVNDILKDYKGLYCIESFDPRIVYWFRKHEPDTIRGQLSMDYGRSDHRKYHGPAYFALSYLLGNFLTRPDFIAYDHHQASNLSRRLCHKLFHNTAVAYTIKSQGELDRNRKNFDIFIFDSFIPQ
ncbi:MAG: hypothetical protein IKE38_00730 [Erysipelotrichaceae bacterium]|nr:hypothetical protein [Erysipelotrichaceae bacterium]